MTREQPLEVQEIRECATEYTYATAGIDITKVMAVSTTREAAMKAETASGSNPSTAVGKLPFPDDWEKVRNFPQMYKAIIVAAQKLYVAWPLGYDMRPVSPPFKLRANQSGRQRPTRFSHRLKLKDTESPSPTDSSP
eukprot:CAMPEP_0117654022 /NCGR_PEP_ID=MMETSP0804-20121206/3518_1 /TAXON_ID=1074897 /ORGANISM="Tetraselmis astigmatica, Strain CCMP880" /LENGTH=136 /DNA_ID=CAMNT_0005460267 /DNA_START=233 /DNA_END=644 /DNA_ORIENTATION=+